MPSPRSPRSGPVLLVGALFLIGVLMEVPGLNGPWYWKWSWRSLDLARTLPPFVIPLVLYAAVLVSWSRRSPGAVARAEATRMVTGLAGCASAFTFAALSARPRGWQSAAEIVRSPEATGYFTDAARIADLADFLASFATLELSTHSNTHPPGPILFWWVCIRLVGAPLAPLLGTVLIGLGVGLGVAILHRFARLWTKDREARVWACFLYALLPGPIVFLPELDQLYPIVTMATLVLWDGALRRRRSATVWLGLALFAGSFMAYNLLTLGAPMLLYALVVLKRERWQRQALDAFALASLSALAVAAAAYALLWIVTAYDPVASLRAAMRTMREIDLVFRRPYWACIYYDVYDFLLAGGMLTLPLVALGLANPPDASDAARRERAMTLVALLSVLAIDLSGLLRAETARVWLFLQPLVAVPAGLQLARFWPAERGLVLALLALIVVALVCKMNFFP